MAPWLALGPSLWDPPVARTVVGGVEVWSMVPSSSLGFFFGPGFALCRGVDSPNAPEFLFVPLGAAFFFIVSVGGSIAVGPLGAMSIGVVSALISIGGEALLATVWSVEEKDGGFATVSLLLVGALSVLKNSVGALSLTIKGSFLAGFLDLLLLAGAGVAADG